jgi:hypothetical protein
MSPIFGPAPGQGGAIRSQGSLTMVGTTIRNNTVQGVNMLTAGGWGATLAGDSAAGGGVWSSGALTFTNCTFRNNAAIGGHGGAGFEYDNELGGDFTEYNGDPGGYASGGALYIAGGNAVITGSTFTKNSASGGSGGHGGTTLGGSAAGAGGAASGGGLYLAAGTLTLRNDIITSNTASGGAGGLHGLAHPPGVVGKGIGGGIYITPHASAALDATTVKSLKGNGASTQANDRFGAYHLIV